MKALKYGDTPSLVREEDEDYNVDAKRTDDSKVDPSRAERAALSAESERDVRWITLHLDAFQYLQIVMARRELDRRFGRPVTDDEFLGTLLEALRA